MRIIVLNLFLVAGLLVSPHCFAQYKAMHPDIVQVIYPEVAAQAGTSVADILIEQVQFDTVKHVFAVTGRVGGLADNRDDSVYVHIDLMRAGRIFKNYYKSAKDGGFTVYLLSTDKCKLYGLDARHAFISIKPPVIKHQIYR